MKCAFKKLTSRYLLYLGISGKNIPGILVFLGMVYSKIKNQEIHMELSMVSALRETANRRTSLYNGGFYLVEKYRREKESQDRYVYRFRLRRIAGQKHIDTLNHKMVLSWKIQSQPLAQGLLLSSYWNYNSSPISYLSCLRFFSLWNKWITQLSGGMKELLHYLGLQVIQTQSLLPWT